MVGSDNPSDVAQALKNRTSMTDTKRHLIEDIGTFGLDKLNDTLGTNYESETAAATALMAGGAVAAEAFQALRGQKGPIRTTVGRLREVGGKLSPFREKEAPQEADSHQSQNTVNQNDSTHNKTPEEIKSEATQNLKEGRS